MKRKKENRGGARKGSGAKLKYGEETVLVGPFRVPKSKKEHIRNVVANELKKFEQE